MLVSSIRSLKPSFSVFSIPVNCVAPILKVRGLPLGRSAKLGARGLFFPLALPPTKGIM